MGLQPSSCRRVELGNDAPAAKEPTTAKKPPKQVVRIILLGSGESGKSTLLRQMKITRAGGYTYAEKCEFRQAIRLNLLEWVLQVGKILADANEIGLRYHCEVLKHFLMNVSEPFSIDVKIALARIISRAPKQPNATSTLQDSAPYFFAKYDEISTDDYLPTEEDICRCRIMTTAVYELEFEAGRNAFVVIDVGGQRGLRRKWIHYFEGLQGMIFVTAIADYDKTMAEDPTTNRVHDSIQLFGALVNSSTFKGTSVILFFNKTDRFKEKLLQVPLSACFKDCDDDIGKNYEKASAFLAKRFHDEVMGERKVYSHFTTATDPNNINVVITATLDIILSENVQKMGFA